MFRELVVRSSVAIRVTRAVVVCVLVLGAVAAGVGGSFDQRSSAQFAFDISVSKGDAPDPVYAGGVLTYSITVTFYGDANSVTISDPLPQGLTFVGDECHLQGIPAAGHGQFTNGIWSFSTVGLIIGSLNCQISARVSGDVQHGTVLTNIAFVTANGFSMVSKTASTTTSILNPPPGPPAVGGVAGLIEGASEATDGPRDAPVGDSGVSVALPAGLGALVVLVSAAGATYVVKRVRREE